MFITYAKEVMFLPRCVDWLVDRSVSKITLNVEDTFLRNIWKGLKHINSHLDLELGSNPDPTRIFIFFIINRFTARSLDALCCAIYSMLNFTRCNVT